MQTKFQIPSVISKNKIYVFFWVKVGEHLCAFKLHEMFADGFDRIQTDASPLFVVTMQNQESRHHEKSITC